MRLQIFDLASRTLSDTPKLVLVGGTYTCVVGMHASEASRNDSGAGAQQSAVSHFFVDNE